VDAEITTLQKVGALANVRGAHGFVPVYHTSTGGTKRVKTGSTVKARILDVDFQKAVVDLTCRPELLKLDTSFEVTNKSTYAVTIVLVKEEHMVVAFENGKLGFAVATTPNDRRGPFKKYVCGGGAEVQVLGRGAKRILCGIRKVAPGPIDAAADADAAELREIGATFEATVKSIKPTQMNLSIETAGGRTVPGRVHISEFRDAPKKAKSTRGSFDGVKVGDTVKVRTIGTHQAKVGHRTLVITQKKNPTQLSSAQCGRASSPREQQLV